MKTQNYLTATQAGSNQPRQTIPHPAVDRDGMPSATRYPEVTGVVRGSFLWYVCAAAFKTRGIIMALPVLGMFFVHAGECTSSAEVLLAGLLLFLAGWIVRIWSQRHLKYRLRKEHTLATTGPYAWTRNPVYIGNILLLSSLCILCRLPWMVPLVAGWSFVIYSLAVRFEEGRLTKWHGPDYIAYCETVPRWLVRRPAAVRVGLAKSADWAGAFAVEWQCSLLLMIPALKCWLVLV